MKDTLRTIRRRIRWILGRDIFFYPSVKIGLESHGSSYGGWVLREGSLDRNSTVYSFGIGLDISFDLSVISKYGCTVHAFDPTPKAIEYVKSQCPPANLIVHALGLSNTDGMGSLFLPKNEQYVSASIEKDSSKGDSISVQFSTLKTIMKELGHARIDYLKMDIEGAEYAVVSDMHDQNLFSCITQLAIEFHHRFAINGMERTRNAVSTITSNGFRLAWVSASGEEFLFVR